MEIIEVNFERNAAKFKGKFQEASPVNKNPPYGYPPCDSRYLEEAQLLEKKWAKHGLLGGIQDKFSRQVTAVMLENQRLMSEQK